MNFKIGEVIEEKGENKKNNGNKLGLLIVIIVAIICGVVVFLISNAIFGKKEIKEEPEISTPLSLSDEFVKILYDYVTYSPSGERNDKFLTESNVNLSSFENQERFYYALQFAQAEDFVVTDKKDSQGRKIYNISSSKIKTYMQRFFGGKVTYSNNVVITHTFDFYINGQNVGIMTYSEENDGFDTIFDGVEEAKESSELIKPYYAELTNAYKEPDGSYRLEEKVIYTDVQKDGNTYNIYIYKDYAHTSLIETRPNQTEEMIKQNPIDIRYYKKNAGTVTYMFKIYNGVLYFDNSTIK